MSDTMRPGDTGQVDAVRAGRRGDAADDRPQVLAYGPDELYPDPYAPSATGWSDEPEDTSFEDYVADPRVVATRAMDLAELALEVTARPDADPEDVVPQRAAIDIALDPPRYADDDPTASPGVTDPFASELVGDEPTSAGPGIVVDERLERRREDVVSDNRRRRRRRVGTLVGLVLVGAGVVGAAYSPLLDVDDISIVGSDQLDLDGLAARTGVRIGDPILFVDPASVAAELRDDPRFVRVVVQRRFPDSISVRLTDRRAIAVVVGPTRGVVVGEGGVIIAVATGDEFLQHVEVTEDPPVKVGSRLSPPLAAAVDVMGSMSFEIAVQIQKMSITAEGELVFDLGEKRTVLFGTVEDAERKLLATKTMLGPQIDLRGVCQLDVRVPTAPTMRRNPDCDPPPPAPVVDPATGATIDPATGQPVAPPEPTVAPEATATTAPPDPAATVPPA